MTEGLIDSNSAAVVQPKLDDPYQQRYLEMHGTFPPVVENDDTPEKLTKRADKLTSMASEIGDIAVSTKLINEAGFLRDEAIRRGQ